MVGYVLLGVVYFFTHSSLWYISLRPLLLTLVVAIASAVVVFAAALEPQAHGLTDAGVPADLAWILSVLLVVIEIYVITLIYSLIVLPYYMDKLFAKVLTDKGYGDLVTNEKHSGCHRMCASIYRATVRLRIARLIVSLPLNLAPVVGTTVYLWFNGVIVAWGYHLYYFELHGYRYAEQKAIVDEHRKQYSAFGMPALFLEMIPGVGPLFLFINTVGAALFAAHMEKELRKAPGYDTITNYNDPATAAAEARVQIGSVSSTSQRKQAGGCQIM